MILILRFKQDSTADTSYILIDQEVVAASGQSPLSEIPQLLTSYSCTEIRFIIPGEQVTSLVASVPKGSAKQAAKALPYIIEDQIASPIEDMHLVHGDISADRQCLVLVIDKQLMFHYHSIAKELGVPVTCIFPEYLGLAPVELPQGIFIDNQFILRQQDGTALVLSNAPEHQALIPSSFTEISADQFIAKLVDLTPDSSGNLLQGEFRLRRSRRLAWQKSLAISIAASLVLSIGYVLSAGWYFHQQATTNEDTARSLYMSLFPEDKRIINIRKQMQGHLEEIQGTPGKQAFFGILSELSNSIAQLPTNSLSPRLMQFNNKDKSLIVEIQATSVSDTSTLQKYLTDRHLASEVLSITKNDVGVIARVEVTLP
jgi:general secretion pathway protein L